MSAAEDQTYYTRGFDASIANTHMDRDTSNCCGYMLKYIESTDIILDVGSGPGTITYDLGTLVRKGKVIGVEPTEEVVKYAEARRPSDSDNVTFQVASAYSLPFPDDYFDLVHAHQVLIHLEDPVKAVTEMRRVLKKGGHLCARDTELNSIIIYPERYDHKLHYFFKKIKGRNTSHTAGSRLKHLMFQAGFSHDSTDQSFSTWCYSTSAEREHFAEKYLKRLENVQFDSSDLYSKDEIAETLNQWADDEKAVCVLIHGEVIGKK